MKQITDKALTPLTTTETTALTTITAETLAVDIIKNPREYRKFGAVDLWNARRNYTTMRTRRRYC